MLAAAPAEGSSAACVAATSAAADNDRVIILPSTVIAAPVVAPPPALASTACPELLARTRDDEVGGDEEGGVGEVARGHFGSRAADEAMVMSVNGPTALATAPAVAPPPVPATLSCPKSIAGARNDELGGVVGGGVVERVGTVGGHFGSSPSERAANPAI